MGGSAGGTAASGRDIRRLPHERALLGDSLRNTPAGATACASGWPTLPRSSCGPRRAGASSGRADRRPSPYATCQLDHHAFATCPQITGCDVAMEGYPGRTFPLSGGAAGPVSRVHGLEPGYPPRGLGPHRTSHQAVDRPIEKRRRSQAADNRGCGQQWWTRVRLFVSGASRGIVSRRAW